MNPITLRKVHVLHVTTKAVLIHFPAEGSEYWLPKSQIVGHGFEYEKVEDITVRPWWFYEQIRASMRDSDGYVPSELLVTVAISSPLTVFVSVGSSMEAFFSVFLLVFLRGALAICSLRLFLPGQSRTSHDVERDAMEAKGQDHHFGVLLQERVFGH